MSPYTIAANIGIYNLENANDGDLTDVPAIYCQTVKIRTSKAWNLRAFNNCLTAQSSIDSNYAVKVLQPYFIGQEYLHSKKNVNHILLTYNYINFSPEYNMNYVDRWSVH